MAATEQAAPVTWKIGAANPQLALRTLQAADKALTDRLRRLNATTLDRWPGFELRIHVSNGSRLFAHEEHGKEIERFVKRILRDGRRGRVHVGIDW